jgi:CheY-like chemotaxis protein
MTPGLVSSIRNDTESWNMQVIEVQGYQRALELMREESREGKPFDVAMLNMALEYVGSLKLSTIMAEDPVLVQIKQIILCTVTQRGQNATLRHEGKEFPCLFLTKPFSRGNLYHALLESLDGRVVDQKQESAFGEPIVEHGEQYRILLVEDNKVNQMVAQGLLKKLGYRAELCETGQDALTKLKENRFDLVLMDCNLPDTDGYEVTMAYRKFEEDSLGILKNSGNDRRTAIIALTANVSEGEEARCFAAGMDDYLTKPIQADKMAIRLRTWLEKAPVQSGVIHTRHASKNAHVWSSSRRGQ